MTSDETRPRRGLSIALALVLAVGAWVTPVLFGFSVLGTVAYWLAAFGLCLMPSWRAGGRDGVDLAAAAGLWAAALAGAVAVFIVLIGWLFAFADWGLDWCSDDWQGEPGDDCF